MFTGKVPGGVNDVVYDDYKQEGGDWRLRVTRWQRPVT